MLKPLEECPMDELLQAKTLCFDLDDTVTLHGKLPKDVYGAMWDLHDAGYRLIAVTGRPAGWADQIARWWPVSAVVAENGAVVFQLNQDTPPSMEVYFTQVETMEESKANQKKLEVILHDVLEAYPFLQVAKDQPYRLWDLAIDIAEDIPRVEDSVVKGVCDIFAKHGAVYKVSSIHVNGWFGGVDKLKGLSYAFQHIWFEDMEKEKSKTLFIGDSPNDEPMFAYFPLSFGVHNILHYQEQLQHPPRYVCQYEEGKGFLELASRLLQKK